MIPIISQLIKEFKEFYRSLYGIIMILIWIGISLVYIYSFILGYNSNETYNAGIIDYEFWGNSLQYLIVFYIYGAIILINEKENGMFYLLKVKKARVFSYYFGKLVFLLILSFIMSLILFFSFFIYIMISGDKIYGITFPLFSFKYTFYPLVLFFITSLLAVSESIFISSIFLKKVYSLFSIIGLYFLTIIISGDILIYYEIASTTLKMPIYLKMFIALNPGFLKGIFFSLSGLQQRIVEGKAIITITYNLLFLSENLYVVIIFIEFIIFISLGLIKTIGDFHVKK